MITTAKANTAKLIRAVRAPLLILVCLSLAACGGSSGTTSSTPTSPPVATVDCDGIIRAKDGTGYADPVGAPKCLAHLFVEIDDLQSSGDIPSDARGVAFIYDFFYDQEDDDDQLQLINAGGLDGNGNFFLTTSDHERLHTNSHGAEVRRVYNALSPVSPAGIISRSLRNTGTSDNPTIEVFDPGEQVRRAYTAARNDNPLITGSVASSPYTAHRAIYNFSLTGSHWLFYYLSYDLSSLSGFEATSNYAEIPTGLIGVGGVGNSNADWSSGFRKESNALLAAGYFRDSLSDSRIAARIEDHEEDTGDSIEVNTDLTDLIARTPTTQLVNLVDHSSTRTPTGFISSAFPDISGNLATIVTEAGQTRLTLGRSLLDLLAGATVHARTGHYYTASYLNADGDDHYYNTHCGVLRDGCFILPNYTIT